MVQNGNQEVFLLASIICRAPRVLCVRSSHRESMERIRVWCDSPILLNGSPWPRSSMEALGHCLWPPSDELRPLSCPPESLLRLSPPSSPSALLAHYPLSLAFGMDGRSFSDTFGSTAGEWAGGRWRWENPLDLTRP